MCRHTPIVDPAEVAARQDSVLVAEFRHRVLKTPVAVHYHAPSGTFRLCDLRARLSAEPNLISFINPSKRFVFDKVGVCPNAEPDCAVPVYNAPQIDAHMF